jgi:site-specific DNA-methyltransferase (adenine-specific)
MIENLKISDVKANPNNPRIIKDDKFKKLVQSIKDFPQMLELRPIVVNDDMIVLGGNMRLKACKEAGLKLVPVIKASDLTPEQQAEFIVKDNVGFGEWDYELLLNAYDSADLEAWGLDLPELPENEIEAKEDDYEIPDELETDIVLGDLFEIGEHRLLCGDSTQVDTWQKVMNEKLCDMVMTDPPYNVDYSSKNKMLNYSDKGNRNQTDIENDKMDNNSFYQFLYDFYTALGSYTKQGGVYYVWFSEAEGINFRKALIDAGILLKQNLIWVKNNIVLGRQDYQNKHESCLYGWKEGAAHYFTSERTHTTVIEDTINVNKLTKDEMKKMLNEMLSDKTKSTIIHCDKPHRSAEHPTMKPILLLAPLIKNSSKTNEIVADGFLGSGSTMVASHQLKRKCYGMELDPKYCQVIIDRMRKLDVELIVKKNGVKI